jgi:hypothetical protein
MEGNGGSVIGQGPFGRNDEEEVKPGIRIPTIIEYW